MNTYRAKFSVPAEALIEIEVTAATQEEGLVLAHDMIVRAGLSQAKVVGLSLGSATNVEFVRIATAATPAVEPAQGANVITFEGPNCTGAVHSTIRTDSFLGAKAAAIAATSGLFSRSGSAAVTDNAGTILMSETARRGGWEVDLREISAGDAGVAKFQKSWIPTAEAAIGIAMSVIPDLGPGLVLRILDCTDRERGPVVKRTFG